MAKAKTKRVQVSVLLDARIDGVDYRAGQVVSLDAALAATNVDHGVVDDHAEAVAYRLSQGEEVVEHVDSIDADVIEEAAAETQAPAAAE